MPEQVRIGVYICHCGGNISEVVDVKDVTEFAGKQEGVIIAKEYEHMCSESGQEMILEDIKKNNLNRIVVASCSPHFHGKTFMNMVETSGLNPYLFEMTNIREQCAWSHFDKPKEATQMAKDAVLMSIEKVRLNKPLEKKYLSIQKRVLVIGGGIAGIQAALDLGDAGFNVTLVEKKPTIGGRMAQLSRTFPTEDCSACILSPKMADVPANKNIRLLINSEVEEVSGFVGNFQVTVKKNPRYVIEEKCSACGICAEKCPKKVPNEFNEGLDFRKAIYIPCDFAVPHKYLIDPETCIRFETGKCGACLKFCPKEAIDFDQKPERITFDVDTIIVTTGADTFDASMLPWFGYGKFENVVSALQMERMIVHNVQGTPLRPMGDRIAFIQCVGSRDSSVGNEYCSRVCCMYATKMAQLLKRAKPDREVYIFYIDLRAYGKGFEEYYNRAQETGVKYVRGKIGDIVENAETKKLMLSGEDTLIGSFFKKEFDLVVLSTGLIPSEGTKKIAEILRIAKSPDEFLQEAHPKFKPVDTTKEGVFIAGCAQGPKDIPDTVAQASGAAARAMRMMNQEKILLDPVKAFVHTDLCDGCEKCLEHCPSGAIAMSDNVAKVNDSLCLGCGSCIAYCPTDALDLNLYENDQIMAEIKSALLSKKDGENRTLVFIDDTCTYRLADNVGTAKKNYSSNIRIIRVPSGSRVTPKMMFAAFKLGADAIFIGECEKTASPYPHSIAEIKKNVETVKERLKVQDIDTERVQFIPFVTVMVGGFVNNMNKIVDIAQNSSAITQDKREKLCA